MPSSQPSGLYYKAGGWGVREGAALATCGYTHAKGGSSARIVE